MLGERGEKEETKEEALSPARCWSWEHAAPVVLLNLMPLTWKTILSTSPSTPASPAK